MKNEASMNEALGQTLTFKSAEQLVKEGTETGGRKDDLSVAAEAPHNPNVVGSTFEKITRESGIEHKASVAETIPETVSLDQLRNDAVARLNGQFQER